MNFKLLCLLFLLLQFNVAVANVQLSLFVPRSSPFWERMSEFARAASQSLDANLKIYNADNSPEKMLKQVEQAAKEGSDGFLFMNYAGIGESILRLAEKYRVPALLINSALDNPDLLPRVHYSYWIGSITPDDRQAGIRLATRLIEQAKDNGAKQFRFLAYIGVPESRAHTRRFEGLKSVVDARTDTTLLQTIANTGNRQQADEDFREAYRQHPSANIVWSYADKYALSAALASGRADGNKKLVFGGIDWQNDALDALARGIIDFDLGGHIFDAAQGVIMLHDYLKGHDFSDERVSWHSAMLIASHDNIASIQNILSDPGSIDYRALSKVHNPDLLQYRFRLDSLPTRSHGQLELSAEQKQWIDAHREITIGVDGNWPPIDFYDENKQFKGITADYLRLISRYTGLRFTPQSSGSFKHMLEKVINGELAAGATISSSPQRAEKLYFSTPFFLARKVIITRNNEPTIHDIKDLSGKTIAMEDGFVTTDFLRQNHPEINLLLVKSTLEALQKVSWRQADAYIGNQAVAEWISSRNQLTNLHTSGNTGIPDSPQNFAVSKKAAEWLPLIEIINKALVAIPAEEKRAIEKRWLGQTQKKHPVVEPAPHLTVEEREWLKKHPRLILGVDPGWKPLEYIDENGRYQGLSSAYMDYFRRVLGLRFPPPEKIAWSRMLEKLQQKEIDVAPMISITGERKKYLNFTRPYITLPLVIFNRRGETLLGGLADLEGKKVAIIQGYSVNNFLQRDYPRLERVQVNSVEEGLDALSTGKADAYIDVLAVGGYQIAAGGYTNLQVASTTPYKLDFSVGVRKDWPELVNILNKVLGNISEQKKNEFLRQWLTVRYAQKTDFTVAFWILGISLVIFILFILRTREMSQINAKLARANAEVEKTSRFKSQFLANMSHEIRTPMNAIVGIGHLLSHTQLNSKQADYIRKLQKSAQSLLGLIDDILDVSKIEAGQLKIEHIEFNLEQLLNDLSEMAQVKLGDKDIEFIYDIATDVPTVMLGDPFRLNQILTNLVSNAIKFTDSGNITLKVCVMTRRENEVRLKFNVTDNGIGIEADKLETLFDPFIQEDGSTTRRYGGTGLGLSISRQLTHLMKGEMGVESSKGSGSTFHFTLPFELPDISGKNALFSLPEPDLRGLSVLLVDDNKQTLEILQHMLTSMTFNVVCVSSGEEALQQLRRRRQIFDLVLLDWRMPEMDGSATTEKIRQLLPRQHLPIIIMMTAYGREAAEQNISEHAEVDGFLVKPVTPSQLFNAIMLAYRSNQVSTTTVTVHTAPMPPLQGTVLLAEDNKINQQVAAETLQQMGLNVHICENGIEVINSLDRIQPDVILMDIQMPLMDGYQTTQEIRNMQGYSSLPIIAMTANAMTEDVEKSIQSGMNAHISKPVDPQYLYNTLKQHLPLQTISTPEKNRVETEPANRTWPQHIAGLAIAQGIKQVGGNERLYQKLLIDFLNNYQDLTLTLRHHLSHGEIEKADRLMHTIKGVSANIGANELMQIATEIHNQIHYQQKAEPESLTRLHEICEELFDGIRQLTQDFRQPDHIFQKALDTSEIDEISQRLRHNDARARKLLEQYSESLKSILGEQPFQQILRLTREYEFEQALRLFEQTLQQ